MNLFASIISAIVSAAEAQPAPVFIPGEIQHEAWDALTQKYLDNRGLVVYQERKACAQNTKALGDYLVQFAPKPKKPAQGDDLIASAINGFNAFAIRWIISNCPTYTIQSLKDSFTEKRHEVGGEKISLDQIEHGTLCAKIGWRTNFSSIFKWYKKDFDKAGGVKSILVRYAPPQDQSFLASSDNKLKFKSYNWGLNDQGSSRSPLRQGANASRCAFSATLRSHGS